MAMGVRPANPGGVAVGVGYLGIALGVLLAARSDADAVLGAPAAVLLTLAGAIAIVVGWTRRTVRWTEERTRRRRVTVWVLAALTLLTLLSWSIETAVSRLG